MRGAEKGMVMILLLETVAVLIRTSTLRGITVDELLTQFSVDTGREVSSDNRRVLVEASKIILAEKDPHETVDALDALVESLRGKGLDFKFMSN